MNIQYMSDTHFEFHRDHGVSFVESLDPSGVDVLVLAGDIDTMPNLAVSLVLFCSKYEGVTVIYVPGNHEYYKATPDDVNRAMQRAMDVAPNLRCLNVAATEINGVKFHGAPLWFPKYRGQDAAGLKRVMNDFFMIPEFEEWVYDENWKAFWHMKDNVNPGDVVVTHHLPHPRCISEKYIGSPLNVYFMDDMREVIEVQKPRLWIHGHTHDSVDVQVSDTRIVCNPFGYVIEELNPNFRDKAVVTLE